MAVEAATQAKGKEAVARDDAREQHVEAISAQGEADYMNTLRRVANTRADSEAHGNRSRFVFILLTGIIMVVLVMVVVWLLATR